MEYLLLAVLMLFLFILVTAAFFRRDGYMCDDIEETVIVTETYTYPELLGKLARQFDNGQPFVIDPADQSKTWVNSHHDMYEDASGRIWELV